jgi:hypothetical protein
MNTKLVDLIKDPKLGLIHDVDILMERATENGIKTSEKEIKEVIDSLQANQLLLNKQTPKKFNSIVAPYTRYQYYIDVAVVNRFGNARYKYILNCIDVHSRYVASRALTKVSVNSKGKYSDGKLYNALEDIFKEMGYPERLYADNQFNNRRFNKLFEKNNVKTFFSDPTDLIKNSLVERFNGTLSRMIKRWILQSGSNQWQKVLQDIVSNYNNKKHSTVKNKPVDIWNGNAPNLQEVNEVVPKIFIGDKVRIRLPKKSFSKSDDIKYSIDVFEVVGKKGNKFKIGNHNKLPRKLYYDEIELQNVKNVIDSKKKVDYHNKPKGNKKLQKEVKDLGKNPTRYSDRIKKNKKNKKKEKIF